jgi:hypothetical protein
MKNSIKLLPRITISVIKDATTVGGANDRKINERQTAATVDLYCSQTEDFSRSYLAMEFSTSHSAGQQRGRINFDL